MTIKKDNESDEGGRIAVQKLSTQNNNQSLKVNVVNDFSFIKEM